MQPQLQDDGQEIDVVTGQAPVISGGILPATYCCLRLLRFYGTRCMLSSEEYRNYWLRVDKTVGCVSHTNLSENDVAIPGVAALAETSAPVHLSESS